MSQYSLYANSFFDECNLGNVCNDNAGSNCLFLLYFDGVRNVSSEFSRLQESLYAVGYCTSLVYGLHFVEL